jgi:uncharacterized protein
MQGYEVVVPSMPETDTPMLSNWLPALREVIGTVDEDLTLVGHSAGVITILRYLEGLREGEKVGAVIMVAGFVDDLGMPELSNFFETPLDLRTIRNTATRFVAISSDNDPFVPLDRGEVLRKELGAKPQVMHLMGHFSGPAGDEASCLSLPEVAIAIIAAS